MIEFCVFFVFQVIFTRAWSWGSPSIHDSVQGAGQRENEANLDKKAKPSSSHQHIPLVHVQRKYLYMYMYMYAWIKEGCGYEAFFFVCRNYFEISRSV